MHLELFREVLTLQTANRTTEPEVRRRSVTMATVLLRLAAALIVVCLTDSRSAVPPVHSRHPEVLYGVDGD